MGYEPAGTAEKLGNRYERLWVVKKIIELLKEEVESITVELIGSKEIGVDLLVVGKDSVQQFHQCKGRYGSRNSWNISGLKNKGVLESMVFHLESEPTSEFVFISATPFISLFDICESARRSDNNPKNFYQSLIDEIGGERKRIFKSYCMAVELDINREKDLAKALDFLQRTHIVQLIEDQGTLSDIHNSISFLLNGEPKTIMDVLLNYVEQDNKLHSPIYVDELLKYLVKNHNIRPRSLEYDERIEPKINELKQQFRETIQPALICNKIIPREETIKVIEYINNGQDVILHGVAGNGKSGILFELLEYLEKNMIPCLPIRLDKRIPKNNAKEFGNDIGLPASPVHSLVGLAGKRKCVLILDQLDTIRWTTAHSNTALEVCKELIREVVSFKREEKEIIIIIACRTYDLENDPEIKNLINNATDNNFNKIHVGKLSEEQLKEIIGDNFTLLSNSQKKILSTPQNLALWIKIKEDVEVFNFNSETELMKYFWEDQRTSIYKHKGITSKQLDEALQPLLNYIDATGKASIPDNIHLKSPEIFEILFSSNILEKSQGRINFYHQSYSDYLIAERLLQKLYEGSESILSWLESIEQQSLFRREQLRQIYSLLLGSDTSIFFINVKEILESKIVRFHLKHLTLEFIGQIEEIPDKLSKYFMEILKDNYWYNHIIETVFWRHKPWIFFLLEQGVIENWLLSKKEKEYNKALWLLRSVAEEIPDEITKALAPFVKKGGSWPINILNSICWNMVDDSEKMFELRLELVKVGCFSNSVDWSALCEKHPLRAIRLIEAIVSQWRVKANRNKGRLENWYQEDLNSLEMAVEKKPLQTWDFFIRNIVRLSNAKNKNKIIEIKRFYKNDKEDLEIDIVRGILKLIISAGKIIAEKEPEELLKRTASLEKNISPIIQEMLTTCYTYLPKSYANKVIRWLVSDTKRFRINSDYTELEWIQAMNLITAMSPYCSDSLFRRLEESIIYYHDPKEKQLAEYYIKYNKRSTKPGYYWGQTQYFLLPSLDPTRRKSTTNDLIKVLERKFQDYSKRNFIRAGGSGGGFIGSKLDRNLEKISNRAWLKIINNKKITEVGKTCWDRSSKDYLKETSIEQFARSLSKIAKRYPERFGKLALEFPEEVNKRYLSSIIDGFGSKKPTKEVPESERGKWQPASIGTIEKLLERYKTGNDRCTAVSFCRLIAQRADEDWSEKTVSRLIYYARKHTDPKSNELNICCNTKIKKASIEILFQNTINCVRGIAAGAIGQLIWNNTDRLQQMLATINSLTEDPHPVVRMASLAAIEPIININKDLAVSLLYKACKDDVRVAASPKALNIFNYIIPKHIKEIEPIIIMMVNSSYEDVVKKGAAQVTARYLFHGLFEKEFEQCLNGNISQRRGVAEVAAYLVTNKKYSEQCEKILLEIFNDKEKDVRNELHVMFRKNELLNDLNKELLNEFIKSKAFIDNSNQFVLNLKNYSGNLIQLSEAIFLVCNEFLTKFKKESRDISTAIPRLVTEVLTILLRLYDQSKDAGNTSISNKCLDIWDLLFENRVGRAIDLTRSIDK